MTLKDKFNFPEGSNATLRYINPVYGYEDMVLPSNLYCLFANSTMEFVPMIDVSTVTGLTSMFGYSKCLANPTTLKFWDVSNAEDMQGLFASSSNKLQNIDFMRNWQLSKVSNMSKMFDSQSELTEFDISMIDTSNVKNMQGMVSGCTNLTTIAPIDCTSVQKDYYPLYTYSNNTTLVNVGGFLNMKYSWNNTYGLSKYPNLTRESCINILNGLYDFTGHSQTPTSSQGQLKVHNNFITAVGDDISIANNKGWVVSA